MSIDIYFAYLLAVVVLAIIPGPSVTLIIGNSLRHGVRAGLLNVAGTQAGLGAIIGIVGLGLASVAKTMGWWFDWLRLAGAVYSHAHVHRSALALALHGLGRGRLCLRGPPLFLRRLLPG
jgi:hypothetical protein